MKKSSFFSALLPVALMAMMVSCNLGRSKSTLKTADSLNVVIADITDVINNLSVTLDAQDTVSFIEAFDAACSQMEDMTPTQAREYFERLKDYVKENEARIKGFAAKNAMLSGTVEAIKHASLKDEKTIRTAMNAVKVAREEGRKVEAEIARMAEEAEAARIASEEEAAKVREANNKAKEAAKKAKEQAQETTEKAKEAIDKTKQRLGI